MVARTACSRTAIRRAAAQSGDLCGGGRPQQTSATTSTTLGHSPYVRRPTARATAPPMAQEKLIEFAEVRSLTVLPPARTGASTARASPAAGSCPTSTRRSCGSGQCRRRCARLAAHAQTTLRSRACATRGRRRHASLPSRRCRRARRSRGSSASLAASRRWTCGRWGSRASSSSVRTTGRARRCARRSSPKPSAQTRPSRASPTSTASRSRR
jgi:hypothetical protein